MRDERAAEADWSADIPRTRWGRRVETTIVRTRTYSKEPFVREVLLLPPEMWADPLVNSNVLHCDRDKDERFGNAASRSGGQPDMIAAL